MHGQQYRGPECDIWSMGVILYTMLTATMPFDDTNFTKFMFKIEKGEYSKPEGVSTGKHCYYVNACTGTAVGHLNVCVYVVLCCLVTNFHVQLRMVYTT